MQKETITFDLTATELFDFASVPSATKVKIRYDLLHTLPSINGRDRCITLPTLINSVNNIETSGKGELINFEHNMEDSGIGDGRNEILGFSSKTFLPDLTEYEIASDTEIPLIPKKAIPLKVEGYLWSRNSLVKKIINQQKLGIKKWKVSVEIAHNFDDGAFYIPSENKFIAVKDAPKEMLECYSMDGGITSYQGKKLAFVWGGERGLVHIAGTGITSMPADKETKLELCVASMSGEPIYGKGGEEMIVDLTKLTIDEINSLRFDLGELDLGTKWTKAYMNDLPDSAFAIIKEIEGKKQRGFLMDVAHLRNSLIEIAQIISGSGKSDFTKDELLAGQKKLISAAKKSGVSDYASETDYNSLVKWVDTYILTNMFRDEFYDSPGELKESILQEVVIGDNKLFPTLQKLLGIQTSVNSKEEINSLVIEAVKVERQKWDDHLTLEKASLAKLQERMELLTKEGFDIASEELMTRIKVIAIDEEGDKAFQKELDYMKSLRTPLKIDTNSNPVRHFIIPGGSFGGNGNKGNEDKVENNTKTNPMVLAL